jgi:hypothetical protein
LSFPRKWESRKCVFSFIPIQLEFLNNQIRENGSDYLSRSDEWKAYVSQIRLQHKAKKRLMETLDALEGGRIIDG